MSEEEFFNRLLNKIDKEFGYDVASTLELMFMTKEKKIEQLENIRKEAIEYINNEIFKRTILVGVGTKKYTRNILDNILNILNKGENNE